ncbi:MAG: hypothetical protein HZA31_01590 [Opitutae bacterium]|nr:hypothetical protein [Opitutae bacterium]
MKKLFLLSCLAGGLAVSPAFAAETATMVAPATERVGVYDSRAVAYAQFWSEEGMRNKNELVVAAKAARAAGDTERARALSQQLSQLQSRLHLQVFSTEPVDNILAQISDQLPALLRQAGVARLVCKWDTAALAQLGTAEQIDVTDQLVQLFRPGEKQLKVLAELKRKPPLPLDQARELEKQGKM